MEIRIGDKFPPMEVKTTQGMKKLPDDYSGKWLVFFSHPADFTPVCTTEFVEFALNKENFQELNTELIALSVDQTFSHIKWLEWIKDNIKVAIPFPVISDPLGEISKKLSMLGDTNTVRAVFIVDDKGIIRAILYYPQEIGRNINEILRIVKILQLSTEHNIAFPANWPYNSLIGNNIILPPPTNIKEAKKRSEKANADYQCYDWWFCFKSIK